MLRFIIRRLIITVILAFVVVTLVFLLLRLIPGDPAMTALGENASTEQLEIARQRMGLNDNIVVQYYNWWVRIIRMDFGESLVDGRPVVDELVRRLPRTFELIIVAAIVALFVGLPAGLIAATQRNKMGDSFITGFALLGLSMPLFVTGSLFVLLFGVILKWLPTGYADPGDNMGKHLLSLVMPVGALAILLSANLIRQTRANMLDVLVRTARSKGLGQASVLKRHVLKNGLIPVTASFGIQLAGLLGGTVVTEAIFNWPGISSLLITAIGRRDYTTIQGLILVIALMVLTINFITELVYAYLNPRIRYK
jgi:ABC-type dipeptide/oligopeptide/nickel transport system permease component